MGHFLFCEQQSDSVEGSLLGCGDFVAICLKLPLQFRGCDDVGSCLVGDVGQVVDAQVFQGEEDTGVQPSLPSRVTGILGPSCLHVLPESVLVHGDFNPFVHDYHVVPCEHGHLSEGSVESPLIAMT